MKKVMILAAIGEAVTGLALLIVPSVMVKLLLGGDLTGVAIPVARVTGIALIGLGIACWPGSPTAGMLFDSLAVTSYLGFVGEQTGVLLWPAVALHAILAAFLGRIWLAGDPQQIQVEDLKS